jgi:hypothetical protein
MSENEERAREVASNLDLDHYHDLDGKLGQRRKDAANAELIAAALDCAETRGAERERAAVDAHLCAQVLKWAGENPRYTVTVANIIDDIRDAIERAEHRKTDGNA